MKHIPRLVVSGELEITKKFYEWVTTEQLTKSIKLSEPDKRLGKEEVNIFSIYIFVLSETGRIKQHNFPTKRTFSCTFHHKA